MTKNLNKNIAWINFCREMKHQLPNFHGQKSSPAKRQRLAFQRIHLRPRANLNPSDAQLVFWALREGILQRLSPEECNLPAGKVSLKTMERLRKIYQASIERFNQRENALRQKNYEQLSIENAVRQVFENNPNYSRTW